jgi:hypothetical protein
VGTLTTNRTKGKNMTNFGLILIAVGCLCLAIAVGYSVVYGLGYPWVIPTWVIRWWLGGFVAAGALLSYVGVALGYAPRWMAERGDDDDDAFDPPEPGPRDEGRFFRIDPAHLN